MKNAPLIALLLSVVLGWTALAAGVLAGFAGHPVVRSTPHDHLPRAPLVRPAVRPLAADAPCPPDGVVASVPCPA